MTVKIRDYCVGNEKCCDSGCFYFLKHNGLCERLADLNYFYTEELIPCTNFGVCITSLVCMLKAQS